MDNFYHEARARRSRNGAGTASQLSLYREEVGGRGRNRTGVHGFAVRCIATLPPGPQRAPGTRPGVAPRLQLGVADCGRVNRLDSGPVAIGGVKPGRAARRLAARGRPGYTRAPIHRQEECRMTAEPSRDEEDQACTGDDICRRFRDLPDAGIPAADRVRDPAGAADHRSRQRVDAGRATTSPATTWTSSSPPIRSCWRLRGRRAFP